MSNDNVDTIGDTAAVVEDIKGDIDELSCVTSLDVSQGTSTRSNLLLCDQCYDSFDIENGADVCKHCGLVYCQECIRVGVFVEQPTECVNCHNGKLSVFDYVTVAKYLLCELHLDGRKLIDDIRKPWT